jgi:hypothetical protein
MALVKVIRLASLILVVPLAIHAQAAKSALSPVPASQRPALIQRLKAYTEAFRTKDWASLYDLVSDENKIGVDNKLKVYKRTFVRDMQGTYDLQRLIKFAPVHAENDGTGNFDIYGCGQLPFGNQKIERIAVVRAAREHGDWFFTNWDYPDPPIPCSQLSDSNWKARNLRVDEPMSQVSCELRTCTL